MNIEPVFLAGIMVTGLFLFIYALWQSVKNPLIVYFLTQFTIVWIFFGQYILDPAGLNFKPHAVVFVLAVLVSFYFIYKNFNYLWSYKPFRYLFIFFLISTVYAIFYKSDFRSSGYMVYLAGLAPLVGFVTGLMAFKGAFSGLKLQNFITLFSLATLGYFILLIISVMAGTSTVMFMEGRLAVNGGFSGGDFEGLLLVILGGFYLYIQQNRDFRFYNIARGAIIANIIMLLLLILLGIKRGAIISLFLAAHVPVYLIFASKLYHGKKVEFIKPGPAMIIIPVLLVGLAVVAIFSPEFVESAIYNISQRFASTDMLDVRMVNWELYNRHWLDNLDFFKVLFGFGVDSSREAAFFLSAMHPDPSLRQPHIHNIYLEMFYNYGLVALLFFIPLISILFRDIKDLFLNNYNTFTCLGLVVIPFFLVFYMEESPTVPSIITFFAFIGFLESLRGASYKAIEAK